MDDNRITFDVYQCAKGWVGHYCENYKHTSEMTWEDRRNYHECAHIVAAYEARRPAKAAPASPPADSRQFRHDRARLRRADAGNWLAEWERAHDR